MSLNDNYENQFVISVSIFCIYMRMITSGIKNDRRQLFQLNIYLNILIILFSS